jgi:CMP-N-acetylneuraminate monooxygenase
LGITENGNRRLLATFQVRDLDDGVTLLANEGVILYKENQAQIKATWNRCKHENGRFLSVEDCVLTCPNHGWKLDASTMTYVNPTGNLPQEQLLVEIDNLGVGRVFELEFSRPWEVEPRPEEALEAGELTVRFYTHACVEIRCGTANLFTDPWLVGPAFTRGWWLVHQPPSDWLDRLAAADAVYISHNHPDHLNSHTLKLLAARNSDVNVYVPDFETDSCVRLVMSAGLKNVKAVPFDVWTDFGPNARFMILKDSTGRDDSGILVDYRGHRLLSLVDCSNLNGNNLPSPVDVLFSSFAGGSSGFPVCWPDQYSEDEIKGMVSQNRSHMVNLLLDAVVNSKAKVVIPYAGYFKEAHPADLEIHHKNVKNTPHHISQAVSRLAPDSITWIPDSGREFDIGILRAIESERDTRPAPEHDFEKYLAPIREDLDFGPLRDMEGIKQYFDWAGFRADLVLHVIETDESFQSVIREFYVDFSDLSFSSQRTVRPRRYLRMRVRADVFRHVLRWGLPWEDISIGFQARFYREPNVYNLDFWSHFQDKLPSRPPLWETHHDLTLAE